MPVMTKTGDHGTTGVAGNRVEKDGLLIETIGMLDELSSSIILVSAENDADVSVWEPIVTDLIRFSSLLANFEVKDFDAFNRIAFLEREIAEKQNAFHGFVYPFGDVKNARLHWLRSIVRRTERQAVRLSRTQDLPAGLAVYLNRLSDFVFTRMDFDK